MSAHTITSLFSKSIAVFLAAFLSIAITSCEEGSPGSSLAVSPSSTTLDVQTGSVELTVTAGTSDDSLPLEWSVTDAGLGRIIRTDDMKATYARLANNGQNRVVVKDQLGIEGMAVITQIADASTSDTDTTTDDSDTSVGIPASALPVGNRITINNFWNDGESFTTPVIETGLRSFQIAVNDSASRPGETHNLSVSGITWSGDQISGFALSVDGSPTLIYP